ncbi:hypothetical protein ElyMa_006185800 [Elysia marginata]|uniref:Uncharacterized protein n=1 Tax=Elysia marginata TaxID=1093978 RepID=A0AAV4H317_9GAST|nr:hypothetical protein ElyMa_006185800 [Elysia marginata]
MASEENGSKPEVLDELGSSFLDAPEGGNGTLDITNETNPSQTVSKTDINETAEEGGEETSLALEEVEHEEQEEEEGAEGEEEAEAEVVDADVSNEEEKGAQSVEKVEPSADSLKTDAKIKEQQEEEEEAKENEEVEKKMAEKFDPNQMPQVNVSILATRRWQIKVYPLRPSDFMSGHISKVFKQAKESLLYLYTAGNNGKFSNGKAELYVSTISQAAKVMHNLIKMEFFHPETNIKIIRKNDDGTVVEKAYMRFDTKMTSLLCQPTGPQRRVGTKRERIIGSVFLKNLPDGATKDMLRVMFPFAAEINFNPEKFKDSTARLVLSNRNGVIPCLKAFSKVELGGNILELRPLEKRDRSEDGPKKSSDTEKSDKPKTDEKAATPSKDATKETVKKDDTKETAEKDTAKKGDASEPATSANQKDDRKPQGSTPKKNDPKQGRGGLSKAGQNNSRFGGLNKKYPQNKYNQQQRWQDKQGGLGGARNRGALRATGRGSGFANNRSRFNNTSVGGGGFRTAASSARMQMGGGMGGRSDLVNAEMTKEMMQLQAQLNNAIKNQMNMLSQTQMALEQAKRGAAVSTAAAAAAMGASGGGGGGSGGFGFSRSTNVNQGQYNRGSAEQNRRNQLETGGRQKADNRNRARDRRESFGNRGARDTRASNFGGKRNTARAGLDSYGDASYPKRSNMGSMGRSWAEETEDLDVYRDSSSLGYGSRGGYADEGGDYTDDVAYDNLYSARSGTSRLYGGSSFGASARNLDYGGSAYDYGY